MNSITPFEFRLKEVFEAFEEAFDYSGLGYTSAALKQYGFEDEETVQRALERAIRVFRSLDIDPRKHYRYYYKVDLYSRQATREWKVSKLGFYLLICNGEPTNPYTSAFQMELLREWLPRLG